MSRTVGRLRDLGVPGAEIDEILRTDDPRLIHRYLELHRERLEERLAEQRATLAGIEALLTGR
jgi:DNA-binding transcriptional MerR regulator